MDSAKPGVPPSPPPLRSVWGEIEHSCYSLTVIGAQRHWCHWKTKFYETHSCLLLISLFLKWNLAYSGATFSIFSLLIFLKNCQIKVVLMTAGKLMLLKCRLKIFISRESRLYQSLLGKSLHLFPFPGFLILEKLGMFWNRIVIRQEDTFFMSLLDKFLFCSQNQGKPMT